MSDEQMLVASTPEEEFYRCPYCGQTDSFWISALTSALIDPIEGALDNMDYEFDENSSAQCPDCGEALKVKELQPVQWVFVGEYDAAQEDLPLIATVEAHTEEQAIALFEQWAAQQTSEPYWHRLLRSHGGITLVR